MPPTARQSPRRPLDRIGDRYGVAKTIVGLSPECRRAERQQRSEPIAEALAIWADATLPKLSPKSELAKAFRCMRSRWKALLRCFDEGRLALDNNPGERALRCVAIGRKNDLFAGSDAGGRRALLSDRERQAQWHQPAALSCRWARPHRRSPGSANR
jgi:hypothetical protein